MRTIRIDGDIDDISLANLRAELQGNTDDITVWINSHGGDVHAAAQMYNLLRECPGKVTVQIDGVAASAASVIAMAGDKVLMSPLAYIVIHNPATIAVGDSAEMQRTGAMLDEIKEGIISAYVLKTKLSRNELSKLMDAEECFNAKRAVQFGFADGILYVDNITRRPIMNLSNLHDQRAALWEKAQAFMNSRTELSVEDCAVYEKMDADIAALGKQIEMMERHREMKDQLTAPTSKPLVSKPGATLPEGKDPYNEAFWNVLRGRPVSNVLSIGTDTSGGYLVPEEFANQLVEALTERNVFRQIAQIVSTSHEKLKVPIATVSGTANWMEENEAIPESDSAFGQVILQAYKLGTLMRASTELIDDSAFNIQNFIAREFARRIGVKEEEAFCTGDGIGKPTGVFTAAGAQVGTTASSTNIDFDNMIDLFHSILPPYRMHAVFLTHDNTMKQLRKIKDNNGQYLWQPAVKEGMPDTILGKPVYISPFAPEIASGNTPIAFGDFSYYWIADRRDVRFKVLNELFAQNDQVGFYATHRVDGKLILPEAIKLLKVA